MNAKYILSLDAGTSGTSRTAKRMRPTSGSAVPKQQNGAIGIVILYGPG
jgi:hypothetical protein